MAQPAPATAGEFLDEFRRMVQELDQQMVVDSPILCDGECGATVANADEAKTQDWFKCGGQCGGWSCPGCRPTFYTANGNCFESDDDIDNASYMASIAGHLKAHQEYLKTRVQPPAAVAEPTCTDENDECEGDIEECNDCGVGVCGYHITDIHETHPWHRDADNGRVCFDCLNK